MEIYIGIYDNDAIYARRLVTGLLKRAELSVQTVEFTNAESVASFSGKNTIELLLVSDKVYTEQLTLSGISRIIILSEDRPDDTKRLWAQENGYGLVFKYQPLSVLVREIMAFYHREGMRSSELSGKTLIAVYSPTGRCGKTGLAIALAEVIGNTRPTLFISFEEYSPVRQLLTGGADIMDVMYYYLQGNLEQEEKRLIGSRHKFDYLRPSYNAEDIKSLKATEVEGFLNYFLSGIYSCVVVDLGQTIREIPKLLPIFDRIYVPAIEEMPGDYKAEAFVEAMSRLGVGINDKIKRVKPPVHSWMDMTEAEEMFDREYLSYVRMIMDEL